MTSFAPNGKISCKCGKILIWLAEFRLLKIRVSNSFFNQTVCRSVRNVSCHRLVFSKFHVGAAPIHNTSRNSPSSKTPSHHRCNACWLWVFFSLWKNCVLRRNFACVHAYRGRAHIIIPVEMAHTAVAARCLWQVVRIAKWIATIHIQKTGFLSRKNPKEWCSMEITGLTPHFTISGKPIKGGQKLGLGMPGMLKFLKKKNVIISSRAIWYSILLYRLKGLGGKKTLLQEFL